MSDRTSIRVAALEILNAAADASEAGHDVSSSVERILERLLDEAHRGGEQAAFEMAASRLLEKCLSLGAVAAIRELAKERARQ